MLYAIKTPEGVLLEKTVSPWQKESWDFLKTRSRANIPLTIRQEMDKLSGYGAARTRSLRKHGFTCVRVSIVENES